MAGVKLQPDLVPLLPEQRRFFLRYASSTSHRNDAVLIVFPAPAEPDVCQRALNILVARHDGLRVGVVPATRSTYGRLVGQPTPIEVERIDLGALQGPAITKAIEAVSERLYFSIDLGYPPAIRAACFSFGGREPDRLLLVLHHFITDGISNRLLVQELGTLCRMLTEGVDPVFPRPASQASTWARALDDLACSGALDADVDRWRLAASPVTQLPVDNPTGDNSVGSGGVAIGSVPYAESQVLLQTFRPRLSGRVYEVMVAALLEVIKEWSGQTAVRVSLFGHGRRGLIPGLNVTRTVGWLSTCYPMTISEPSDRHWIEGIRTQFQRIPHAGASFGVLRYMSPRPDIVNRLAELGEPEITLNYLGVQDGEATISQLAAPISERTEPNFAARSRGSRLHGMWFVFLGGQLFVVWSYSERMYHRSTIDELLQGMVDAATRWIHCDRI